MERREGGLSVSEGLGMTSSCQPAVTEGSFLVEVISYKTGSAQFLILCGFVISIPCLFIQFYKDLSVKIIIFLCTVEFLNSYKLFYV